MAQTAQQRRARLLLQRDARLALELCVHLAQQLVSGALDLHADNREAEHGVTKQCRVKGHEVEGHRSLVEEGDVDAPPDGAAIGAIDTDDAPVLAVHHGGDGGGEGVGERMAGERKGGDK